VVTEPMVRTQDGSGYGTASRIRTAGPSEAARRGAVAFLLRSLATDSRRSPHAGMLHYADDAPRIPAAALTVPDAEQLYRLVALGGPVRVRLVLTPRDLGPVTSQNVVAELRGREKPDEVVLLGAHLDSWDLGTGAIDDGAGDAIIMGAASLIHDMPQRPRRTIRLVLYGSEEMGLLGGHAYAEAHRVDVEHLVVVAEPDFGQGPIYKFQTGVTNAAEASLVKIRAALAPLGILSGDNLSRGSSDVEPLAELGVPAVTLSMDGMDYFDYHHTPDDTLDKVQPARLNQSVTAYAVFAYLAAELEGNYRGSMK
jgi:carboxypeptidase Q